MAHLKENRLFPYCLAVFVIALGPLGLFATDTHTKATPGIEPERKRQFAALIKQLDELVAQEAAATAAIDWKSEHPDYSAATRIHEQISATFKAAVEKATDDPEECLQLAKRALDQDTSIRFAEKALSLKVSAEGYFLLGQALNSKYSHYIFSKSDSDRTGLERATEALRSAVRLSGARDPKMIFVLGESLLYQYRIEEAETEYLTALRVINANRDSDLHKEINGSLIMTAYLSKSWAGMPGFPLKIAALE